MAIPVNPVPMLWEAAKTNNIPMLEEALELVLKDKGRDIPFTLGHGLTKAVTHNSREAILSLLNHGANLGDMSHFDAKYNGQGPNIQTLQFLLDQGWDINNYDDSVDGNWRLPFLWTCLEHQDLIDWCLEHGARVDIYNEKLSVFHDGVQVAMRNWCPPLLDRVARYGTVAQFEFFRSRGAPLGFRMLHNAVQTASSAALPEGMVEPADSDEDPRSRNYKESMKMVKHILQIDEVDVNAQRVLVGDMCSTALCYVALRPTKNDYRPLTRLLLDAGADPDLLDHDQRSPRLCGEWQGNRIFLEALEQWEKEKREQTASSS